MNIRSLTRGDGVVIGAALLLFIASFLDIADLGTNDYGFESPSAWGHLPLALGVFLGGVIGAALIVVNRCLPQPRKVAGHDLGTVGVAFTVFAFWYLLWQLLDSEGSAGAGLILGFIAALLLAGAAVAGSLVPALQAPLINATPRPAAPQPYGAQPPNGYGYPGAQQQPQPYGGQPQQGGTPAPAQQQAGPEFSPFWFAVPTPRALYAEDGSPTQIAELAPGVWYLAVDQRGPGLVAQTQDGRRGLLQDASGIQRG
ncbi:DUF5336 domain-containing protein [Streptomyces abyssomicinicus]|uniref:DUF5336 domain-containing protein n=1 Tax=Streptomyces abyssomicinicus TaxID=574929 RepID=UPI001583039D|nr:DUF5336 domain-containing protein [Streptomyces abyssomicinicus]